MLENELLYHCWAYLILAGAGGLIVGALACWKLLSGGKWRLLPSLRGPQGTWSGHEVFLVFLFFLLSPPAILALLEQLGFFEALYGNAPTLYRKQLWVWLLATPLIVAGVFLVLHTVSRTRPARYGMTRARAVANAILGYVVWLVLMPIVFGVFLVAIQGMSLQELAREQHPLERLGRGKVPLWPVEWGLILFQAVVAAPLVEELVFRGILLGWLRRAGLTAHTVLGVACLVAALVLGSFGSGGPEQETPDTVKWEPVIFIAMLLPAYWLPAWALEWQRRQNALAATAQLSDTAASASPLSFSRADKIRVWMREFLLRTPRRADLIEALVPIYGSALLFAAFHSSVWPSPIPLFVFGLGVGWLAYRTRSLVGAVVVHALFNAVATLVVAMTYADAMSGKDATTAGRPSDSGSMVKTVPASQWPRFK